MRFVVRQYILLVYNLFTYLSTRSFTIYTFGFPVFQEGNGRLALCFLFGGGNEISLS